MIKIDIVIISNQIRNFVNVYSAPNNSTPFKAFLAIDGNTPSKHSTLIER